MSHLDNIDVLVAGGGIVGLTTAILLQRAGLWVAVLEARSIAGTVTANSTVKVTIGHGTTLSDIESARGRDAAAAYAQANQEGMRILRDLANTEGISCDFQAGQRHLVYAEKTDDAPRIAGELAVAQDLGLDVTRADASHLPFPVSAAIAFEDQASFHPANYLAGLAHAFQCAGGVFLTGVRVIDVDENADSCSVSTSMGDLTAEHVVIATGYPILDRGAQFSRLYASRSYGIAGVLPSGMADPGMTINIGSPTHSTRTVILDGERLLIVVGEGHEVGRAEDAAERWDRLRAWAGEWFGVEDFRYNWSAQETRSEDHLPFAGMIRPGSHRVYTASGFGGWGMTNGSAAASLISDLVMDRELPPWAEAFDARRSLTRLPGAEFVRQNLQIASTLAADRLGRGKSVGELAALEAGHGAVFTIDGSDTAVYRDEDGGLHGVSAICTHLGCNVAFNRAERSWDCPCHGSRFSLQGEVLQGPATRPLAPVDPNQD